MGLLGDIYSASDTLKRRIKGLLADPVGYVKSLNAQARDYNRNVEPVISGGLLQERPLSEKQLQDKYTNLAMLAPLGMIVWHGSPHKFSKFDMNKIGTGEGAQAYGQGIYTAEAPSVAIEYQQAVSNAKAPELYRARSTAKAAQKDIDQITAWLDGSSPWPNNTQGKPVSREFLEKRLSEYQGDVKWANDVMSSRTERGQLYKIDIPDEAVARMLDWDKPLSQQTPEVQESLKSLYKKRPYLSQTTGEHTGQSLYNAIGGNYGGITSGSDRLKAEGILGIRYLDRGSRGYTVDLMLKDKLYASNKFDTLQQAQQYAADKAAEGFATKISQSGTSNFVLFDDQLPRILEINGQATGNVPWKPGEWDGLLGP
jgi:hypothetical protein